MIIFVEGPDNVGKGTQITNIYKNVANNGDFPFWGHYANYGVPSQLAVPYAKSAYWGMFDLAFNIQSRGHVPIFDRAHLGEWVYGKKYRKYDATFIWDLEKEFANDYITWWHKTYLIVFTDNPENLIKRDDGLSFSKDLLDKNWEVERFEDAYNRSIITNKILINIDSKNPEQVWSEVKEFLWPE